jgi:hypothetical protein
MERSEGQIARIRYRESDTFVKAPHQEYCQVRSQVDMTICGNRQDEAECISPIRLSRLSYRAFLECGNTLLFLCLNQNCKRRSLEL